MKIYTRVVIDIETGLTLDAESFEYQGPIAKCEPISAFFATVGTFVAENATLFSMGSSILSSVVGGIQQSNALGAQAANADAEAKQALKEGKEVANRRRQQAEELASTQLATLGASNIDIMGSPMDVIVKDRGRGELYAQDAIYASKITAQNKQYEATLARYKQSSIIPNTLLSIGGTAISGGKTLLGSQTFGATSLASPWGPSTWGID